MKIGYEHIYSSYRDLIVHSENISWARFQSVLIINSILVVAWATLFATLKAEGAHPWLRLVMSAIAVPGILTGFAWADLGMRSRDYLDEYKKLIEALEKRDDKWEEGIPLAARPFQIDIKPRWYSSSRFLLYWTPVLFAVLNVVLLFATWASVGARVASP